MFRPALLALLLSPALAGLATDHESARRAVAAGQIKPLAEILAGVQKQHAGRVLDVELERDAAGRQWYEIKLLTRDGQKVEIHVDAVTGREVSDQHRLQVGIKPLGEVLRGVLKQHPGLVRKAELEEHHDGRKVYTIVLELADGRDQRLVTDAQSGQLLSADAGRIPHAARLRPLPEVIDMLEQRYRGRAVEAEVKLNAQGLPYYEIELQQSSGRGLDLRVDALNGQVLRETLE